jgi:lipase maturation factor 1
MRGLALIYLIAFASVFVQVLGLMGSQGILPASLFLKKAALELGGVQFFAYPTLFWIDSSDNALRLLTGVGMLFSMLVVAGICTGPLLFLLWLMYLSVVTVGGDFMSFQWDILLLETGFLSIFFSHHRLLDWPSKFATCPEPSRIVLWLLRFLLFKLMLSSGCVKLLSGDVTWQNFTALIYHYWTQPLPTPLAWLAAQLPAWFQKFSVGVMFVIELIVPFFFFAPRKLRFAAACCTVFFQTMIILTGNYTFFNLLTILLCLLLLDDQLIQKFMPKFFLVSAIANIGSPALEVDTPNSKQASDVSNPASGVSQPASIVSKAALIFSKVKLSILVSTIALLTLSPTVSITPEPLRNVTYLLSPFFIANTYGLFAVMTTTRKEIIVEASEDGKQWEPYQFYFKPGDLKRAPPWVAPYQPRLDWQMWFAALGRRRDSPWFAHLVYRLLQGSADVRGLLQKVPFDGRAPKYVRASLFDYQFTNWNELTTTGAWWKRKYDGLFFPEASLRPAAELTAPGTESENTPSQTGK